ncbi:hypothetical protein [Streptomyces anthocyanicus]|uniref:hypothetical protein n=1 Tax=Streptomyces anthocyanicus TaxID=68174 RepID=UPI002F917B57|nr:hypothetical protein OH747_40375 [Streptomyces anthocyanicus]
MRFARRTASADAAEPKARVGRRRVLGGLGASGLVAAAGVFSSASPAAAADNDQCCNLANPPGTSGYTTMTYCRNNADYLWTCSMSSTLHCTCCETSYNEKSAFECRYN